ADCSGNSPKSPSSAIILSSKSICLENHIRLTLDTEKSHSLVGWVELLRNPSSRASVVGIASARRATADKSLRPSYGLAKRII
ncbi:hypothetical protein, partial [Bradyrhizobium zhanjiangense]|uniref:hypothetical protein n=1 Tax=Bradyrhizobium zhanjiangense TaxID=1325107 RepID=UPI0019D6DFF5